MKRFASLVLFALFISSSAGAQSYTLTQISAQHLYDTARQPLTGTIVVTLTDSTDTPVTYTPQGGSPSTATFTANVKNGAIQLVAGNLPFTVPAAATTTPSGIIYRIQTKDQSSNTVWTFPKTPINQQYYSVDGYIAQAAVPISGTGAPSVPRCAGGAQYTDTTSSTVPWACTILTQPDNTTVWTQNPSLNAQCSGTAIAYPLIGTPYCIHPSQAYLLPGYVLGNNGATPAMAQPIIQSGGGGSTPAPPAYAVQIANPTVSALDADPYITINPTAHVFGVGTGSIPGHVTVNGGCTGTCATMTSADGITWQMATHLSLAGNISAVAANFSGALTGTTANLSGALVGAAANFSGTLTGVNANFSGALTGVGANLSGTLTGTTGNFSGNVASAGAVTGATVGGSFYAAQNQTGGGGNGIVNSTAYGRRVIADPNYLIATTATMSTASAVITVASATGIVPGMYVSGNFFGGVTVASVAGNNVTVTGGNPLSSGTLIPVNFFEHPYFKAQQTFAAPSANSATFSDSRLGWNSYVGINPGENPLTGQTDFSVEDCFSTKRQGWFNFGPANGGTRETCHTIFAWYPAPSTDYGTTIYGSQWGTNLTLSINDSAPQEGISEMLGGVHAKSGIGDGPLWYFYYADYLGSVAGSDEGQGGPFFAGGEANITYTGTVATGGGGTGATQLSVTCATDCSSAPGTYSGGPGDGRYMIDESNPTAFNMTSRTAPSALIPGYFVVDATVPVSTFWGKLNADVATPTSPANSNGVPFSDGTTDMTFTVNTATLNSIANSGNPQVGDLVCFSWPFHEQAKIKAVNSGTFPGPWSITVPLRNTHRANSWIFANGTCGDFADFTANDVAINATTPSQILHYPFDIDGSIDAHTMAYTWFSTFGVNGNTPIAFPLGHIVLPLVTSGTVTNSGGIVTFTGAASNTAHPELYNQPTLSITGASDSAYNGTCTNSTYNVSNQLTCYQAASIGHGSASGLSVSIGSTGYGNTGGVLWQGAQVLDILDYNQTNCAATAAKNAPCFDSKNMTMEPNAGAWPNGGAVEESHHYSSQLKAEKQTYFNYDPYNQATVNGWYNNSVGPGICCGLPIFELQNSNPASLYQGHGGTVTPPAGIFLESLGSSGGIGYNYALNMRYAPEPQTASVISVGCPSPGIGCTDRSYSYNWFSATGNSAGLQTISFAPGTSNLKIGNGTAPITWNSPSGDMNFLQMRDNLKFAPLATPVIVASLPTSSTSGVIPDATTHFYTVTAKSNAGSSLASAEVSKTTGSTGSNTNSITVQWGRVTGATSYQVCESSTTGTELLLTTVSAVNGASDVTYFLDTGGLTAAGACLNSATQPGLDQAGFVGVENANGTTETKIFAAANATTTFNEAMPETGTAGSLVDKVAGATVVGDVTTFSNVTGRVQDSGTLLTALAPKASPALTGTPTAPTPATADNSTTVATTAFVKAQGYTLTIASGTATMTTAAIAAGACGTTVTVTATGTATTDAIAWAYNAAVAANPGVLRVLQWPTSGNVNFAYCNGTAASVTPTAATLNWRVTR